MRFVEIENEPMVSFGKMRKDFGTGRMGAKQDKKQMTLFQQKMDEAI